MGMSTLQPPAPSSPGKTGWEREDVTPTTPIPACQLPTSKNNGVDNKDSVVGCVSGTGHQHSHSLFDFFRGRKLSLKNNTFHQQAAAAAAAAATAPAATSGSGSDSSVGGDHIPAVPLLPLMRTPPPISKSRLGSVAAFGSPKPLLHRNQSLDVAALGGYRRDSVTAIPGVTGMTKLDRQTAIVSILSSSAIESGAGVGTGAGNGAGAGAGAGIVGLTPTQIVDVITSSTIPLTTVISNNNSNNNNNNINSNNSNNSKINSGAAGSSHPITNAAQSTFSKVAAAVVGATVGKRRPSVVNELEAVAGVIGVNGLTKYREKPSPTLSSSMKQNQYNEPVNERIKSHGIGQGHGAGLDAEQLQNHSWFMRSEQISIAELVDYIEKLYNTTMSKEVALEYLRTQVSVLHKELDQNRSQSESDKKSLTDQIDTLKNQVVKMEENFLLWRTKVHNDQMAQQEDFLQERLVKQDRIEELEETLFSSQEEVTRLRSRLLVLEYEDGYVGPTAFISSTPASPTSSPYYDTNNPSTTIAIEHGPITVNSHKRRSGDFKIMEQRAQKFETQVEELKRTMEKERQGFQKDLVELRMKLGARCSKLEHDVHAAKMEATMYNEMMHEVVSENDDLRQQIKDALRKLRRHGLASENNNSSTTSVNTNGSNGTTSKVKSGISSSRPRRSQDYYGFPDDGFDSQEGSDDEMEDIAI
ncbi:hypothetical protein FBU30_002901 [Linnemannia zychae]|nr:hypothetical protein FBU30_002901 [Linnemannia zychae]